MMLNIKLFLGVISSFISKPQKNCMRFRKSRTPSYSMSTNYGTFLRGFCTFWENVLPLSSRLQGRSGGCWSNCEVGNQHSIRVLTHGAQLNHSRDVRCRSYKHAADKPSCRNQTVHWQSGKRKHEGSSSPTNTAQHRMWTWCNCDEQ